MAHKIKTDVNLSEGASFESGINVGNSVKLPSLQAGDIIVVGAHGELTNVGPGNTGDVLSRTLTGIAWSSPEVGNPMTDEGDVIVGGVEGLPTRLPHGAGGTVLTYSAEEGPVWRIPGRMRSWVIERKFTATVDSPTLFETLWESSIHGYVVGVMVVAGARLGDGVTAQLNMTYYTPHRYSEPVADTFIVYEMKGGPDIWQPKCFLGGVVYDNQPYIQGGDALGINFTPINGGSIGQDITVTFIIRPAAEFFPPMTPTPSVTPSLPPTTPTPSVTPSLPPTTPTPSVTPSLPPMTPTPSASSTPTATSPWGWGAWAFEFHAGGPVVADSYDWEGYWFKAQNTTTPEGYDIYYHGAENTPPSHRWGRGNGTPETVVSLHYTFADAYLGNNPFYVVSDEYGNPTPFTYGSPFVFVAGHAGNENYQAGWLTPNASPPPTPSATPSVTPSVPPTPSATPSLPPMTPSVTPSVTPTPSATPSASAPPPSSIWPPPYPATFDANSAFYVYAQGPIAMDPDYEGYWYPADAVTNEGRRVYRNTTKWARSASFNDWRVVSLHATHEDAIAGTNAVYVITDEYGSEVDIQYQQGKIFPAEYGWDWYDENLCGFATPPA